MPDQPTGTGFVSPLLHVNRADRSEPFCGCHDDPWALCPDWRRWGVTAEEHAAAVRRSDEIIAEMRRERT